MKIVLDPKTVIGDCLEAAFNLEKYCKIITAVSKAGFVATDDFRKDYNGFYRVQRRSAEWYDCYYSLLAEQKTTIRSFEELLRELYTFDNKLEVSFASKLIATVDTLKPVWDHNVIVNLGFDKKWERARTRHLEERIQIANDIYSAIIQWYQEFIPSPAGTQCIEIFDRELPKYKNAISNVKKIDFFLWRKG